MLTRRRNDVTEGTDPQTRAPRVSAAPRENESPGTFFGIIVHRPMGCADERAAGVQPPRRHLVGARIRSAPNVAQQKQNPRGLVSRTGVLQ